MERINYLDEEKLNNKGTLMKIIEFNNQANIVVEFQDEHKYTTPATYCNFKRGTISNPYDRHICGIGYISIGKYPTKIGSKPTATYSVWHTMLVRCYDENLRYQRPAYAGCTVCEEWQCFQNFAAWYEEHYYDIGESTRMHIDKDILVKGNKHYSPETCLIVPQRINMIFMKKTKNRDSDLPNAIYRCASGYRAFYNGKVLGRFKELEDAIEAHDNAMKIHILNVAEEYKGRIQPNAYNALINWTMQ